MGFAEDCLLGDVTIEPTNDTARALREGADDRIARIEDGNVPFLLIGNNLALRLGVLLHRGVQVEIVRGAVEDNRDIGGNWEVHELEGAQFQDNILVICHW